MKKIILAAAVAVTAPSIAFAECGEVSITEMNWDSSAVVTYVSKFLMEQGYGCTVTTVPSATVTSLASVAETGTPDIVTELWINGTPAYGELSEAGRIVTLGDVLSDGGVDGWWVPTYLVEEHPELATLAGVQANADLLGNRFHNCPDGWGCRNTSAALAEAAELEANGFEIFQHGSGETMAASIAAAFENREPWIGYYWAPTSVLGQYDMTMVDLGPYNEEIHMCNTNPECEEVGLSSFPVSPVKTIVTTTFQEEFPEVSAMMANVSFTNAQMGEILAWKEANNASAEEAAVYFIANNSDIWSTWLNDEARGNLAGLIQ